MNIVVKYVVFSLCITVFSSLVLSQSLVENRMPRILAVLAHPDDETWFSGIAAKIASKNKSFSIVYATSGDAGHDVSGQGLCCKELAIEREKEAQVALSVLGVQNAPIFLKLPDSKLTLEENKQLLKSKLQLLFQQLQPEIILTFGEDGVTGHTDHRLVGTVTREVADLTSSVQTVLNVAVSESRAKLMNQFAENMGLDLPSMVSIQPVNDKAIDIRVNVGKYADNRVKSYNQYKTQFPKSLMEVWTAFVPNEPIEEIVVARRHKPHNKYLMQLLQNN